MRALNKAVGFAAILVSALFLIGAIAPEEPNPRLYVHIKTADQAEQAKAFRSAMEGASLLDRPINVTSADLRPRGVTTTEVRCFNARECAFVAEVAAQVERVLEGPVRIHDMSAIYEESTANRPFHYEIWFGDGPIVLRDDPLDSGSEQNADPIFQSEAPSKQPINAGSIRSIRSSDTLVPGDPVVVTLSAEALFASSYDVTVDGIEADSRPTETGLEFFIPQIEQGLLSDRIVEFDILVDGQWIIEPEERLNIGPSVSLTNLILASLLAVFLAVAAFFLQQRMRAQQVRAAASDAMKSSSYWTDNTDDQHVDGDTKVQLDVPDPPEDLVRSFAAGKVVLFLGSGITAKHGNPSHAQILSKIAAELGDLSKGDKAEFRALLKRGDTDTMADVLVRRLGRDRIVAELYNEYQKLAPTHLTKLLESEDAYGLINASFAPLSMLLVKGTRHISTSSDFDFISLLQNNEPFALELNRDVDREGRENLSRHEIAAAIDQTPNLRSTLSGIYASKTVLFLGLNASQLIDAMEMLGIRQASSQRHVAVMADEQGLELSTARFREQFGIELLKIGSPNDLKGFADKLLNRVKEHAKGRKNSGASDRGRRIASPKISSISLRNVGPFEKLDIDFEKSWSVLLGNNGTGKSTVLRAIAFALCGEDPLLRNYASTLLRRGSSSGSISITLDTDPSPTVLTSTLVAARAGRVTVKASAGPLQSGTMQAFGFPALRGVPPQGPVEIGSDGSKYPDVMDVIPIISGIDTRGEGLRAWIKRCDARSNDPNISQKERESSRSMVVSLFELIDEMTHGIKIKYSHVDTLTGEILLDTDDGKLPMDFLSQGLASTLGWAGPLIQRLYEIGGAGTKPEDEIAVLLIDEIDSHLHPEWQQKLVPSLKKHFPNLQVIATTHSPLMVGNLEQNEVMRVVRTEEGGVTIEKLEQSFVGYRFDQILTDEAFGLELARAEIWTARDEYLELMALPDEQKDKATLARIKQLREEIQRLPGPQETPSEWEAAKADERKLEELVEAAKAKIQREKLRSEIEEQKPEDRA